MFTIKHYTKLLQEQHKDFKLNNENTIELFGISFKLENKNFLVSNRTREVKVPRSFFLKFLKFLNNKKIVFHNKNIKLEQLDTWTFYMEAFNNKYAFNDEMIMKLYCKDYYFNLVLSLKIKHSKIHKFSNWHNEFINYLYKNKISFRKFNNVYIFNTNEILIRLPHIIYIITREGIKWYSPTTSFQVFNLKS